jgi:hypothetical protein
MNRRSFLRSLAVGTAAIGLDPVSRPPWDWRAEATELAGRNDRLRAQRAYKIRTDAARLARHRPPVSHPDNGEEDLYPNRIASYSKGLPHSSLGEVDLAAYDALLRALRTGERAAFEAIPLGLGRKLTNPQAGLAFDLEGPDSHHLSMRPPPTIASAEAASELAELYWMALARDVHFLDY